MDILDNIMSAIGYRVDPRAKPNSSQQLADAQKKQAQTKVTPAMEAEAKKAGFKTYAEYDAWRRQRQNRTGGSVPKKAEASLKTGTASHPIAILDNVNEALKKAKKP